MDKNTKIVAGVLVFAIFAVVYLMFTFFGEEISSKDKIVVIPIKGMITSSGSDGGLFGGEGASSDSILNEIKNAEKNLAVKAIILEINSPGGTVVGTEEISRAVAESKKPIVAWIREVGASGAYWIASSCDYIVADPMSLTGSIGVSSSYLQFSGVMDKYGVSYVRLVAGDFKDIGSPYKNMTTEERNILEIQLKKVHEFFIKTVADNRNITVDSVREHADGGVFLGVDALEYDLIDKTGGKKEAIEKAKELAGVKDAELIEVSATKGLLASLLTEAATNVGYGIGKALVEVDINAQNLGIVA